jgi:membrane peptidoglycan carboxypeptidase
VGTRLAHHRHDDQVPRGRRQEFSPRNPDGRTHGTIPLKQALGNSYNIPAFKTILLTGYQSVVETAKAMGLTTLDRDLGPALTLGGVDITLLDQVYAYSTFANNGVMIGAPTTLDLPAGNRQLDPIAVQKVTNRRGDVLLDNTVPDTRYVLDPEYAYMITDILSADANRQVTYGRGSNLNITGHRVAVKTGTSEPYEDTKRLIGDTWTIGYTPDIAVGVWAGNSDNTPMTGILSTSIAGATWHDVISAVLKDRPARDWVKPERIVKARVCVPSGIVVEAGINCRSVEGEFAAQSLRHADTWGGTVLAPGHPPISPTTIPAEITEWKRYVAQEYLRQLPHRERRTTPATPPAAPTPATEPAPPSEGLPPIPDRDDDDDDDGGGNGNGNGNGRE